MTQHRNLDYGQRLPEAFLDAIQELLGSYASPNFALTLANATTVQVVAGAGDDQVCVAIDGRWRWRSSTVNAAHPGGAAGTHAVYVTASDNAFVPGTPETDNTIYTFLLEIRTSGTPATALHRKVADVVWNGSAITSIIPTVPSTLSLGSITSASILDGTIVGADISQTVWTALNGAGTLAARPAAAPANAGYLYFATDVESIYRSDGAAWTRFGAVTVLTAQIGDAQVTLAKLAANSVDSSKIVDGSIALADLAADSVNASKIVDLSVGTAELADGSVTLAKHAANSVDSTKIVDGSIARRKLEAGLGMDALSFACAWAEGVVGSPTGSVSVLTALECSAGSGLQVLVASGFAYVQGDDAANQGMLLHRQASTGAQAIVGNASGNPRVDAIVVRYNDELFTGRTPPSDVEGNLGSVEQIQGTPAAGASLANLTGAPGKAGGPAFPPSALLLAYLLVPNGAASFSAGSFLDQRKPAGPAIWGEDGNRWRIGIDAAGNIGKEDIG